MKTNHKWLKAALALGVRKLGLFFLASKLSKFLLFDDFFPNLADFRNLDNFLPFEFPDLDNFLVFNNFPDFLYGSLPPSMLLTSLAASILVINTSLIASTYDDIINFSIDISSTAILLNS